MSIVKIVELIGSSKEGWQNAAENAVERAAETIRNIHGVDVSGWTAKVDNGKISEYRANVKISFVVEKATGGEE